MTEWTSTEQSDIRVDVISKGATAGSPARTIGVQIQRIDADGSHVEFVVAPGQLGQLIGDLTRAAKRLLTMAGETGESTAGHRVPTPEHLRGGVYRGDKTTITWPGSSS